MKRFIYTVGLAGIGALVTAFPATAQRGSSSDATVPTAGGSSGTVGGLFTPSPAAPATGTAGATSTAATTTATASPASTQASGAAATQTSTQMSTGTLSSPTGAAIPPAAQGNVLSVMTGGASPAAAQQVQTSLAAGGAPPQAVSNLVDAVGNLLASDAALNSAVRGIELAATDEALRSPALAASIRSRLNAAAAPDPVKLTTAIMAFNAVVTASTPEYLANPPGEFLAIHAVLNSLVTAFNGAAAR